MTTYKPVGVDGSSHFPPRVEAHIQALIDAAVAALVAGAPGALDTLKELADQLASDESATAALTTGLATKASTSALNGEISRATTAEAAAQAYAIQRGNHTGTQAESTVTNLVSDLAAKAAVTDLSTETARATAAEVALQNLTNSTFVTGLNNAIAARLARQYVIVDDLAGVDPTGATSSTAALNAVGTDKTLVFTAGATYKVLGLQPKSGQTWLMDDVILLKDGGGIDTHVMESYGSLSGTSTTLTSDATAASADATSDSLHQAIQVTSAAGFSVGDWVVVRDATYAFGTGPIARNQEINRIYAISGTEVVLANRILGNYAVASTAEVVKLNPITGLRIRGGTMKNPATTSPSGGLFDALLNVDVRLYGVTMIGPSDDPGIFWRQSYNCHDFDCQVRDGLNLSVGGYGYGHYFEDSSHGCTSTRLRVVNVREAGISNGSRDCEYVDPVSIGAYDNGFNTHGQGVKKCQFVRPKVLNCRGTGITVGFSSHSAGDSDIDIIDPYVENCGSGGIAASAPLGKENSNIRVHRPVVKNVSLRVSGFQPISSNHTFGFKVIEQDVDGGTSTNPNYGVLVSNSTDVVLRGGKIRNIANGYGIGWTNVAGLLIDGVDIAGVSSYNLRSTASGSTDVTLRHIHTDDTTLSLNGDETLRNNSFGGKVDSAFTIVKSGTPVDADFGVARDGMMEADSSTNNLWVRIGGTWRRLPNRTDLATVATTGAYSDLVGAPASTNAPIGFPTSVIPGAAFAARAATANRIYYMRNLGDAATITKIGLHVGTASGNIEVGVYGNTGTARSARPGTRKGTTGLIACPATGYQEVTLAASTAVAIGDWLAILIDNVTATIWSAASSSTSSLFHGMAEFQDSLTALPSTATSASQPQTFPWALVGVP